MTPRRAVAGRVHPFDGQDETHGREHVEQGKKGVIEIHFFSGSRFLNILSMRSVIR